MNNVIEAANANQTERKHDPIIMETESIQKVIEMISNNGT